VPETISVLEAIPVLEMPSSVFCEAMAGKTMPSEMTTATSEMAASTAEASTMPTTEASTMPTTEASTMPTTTSTMPTTTSTMATASSTMCEHGGGRERQNAGQNQTDQ
jgi:hypothetical protein